MAPLDGTDIRCVSTPKYAYQNFSPQDNETKLVARLDGCPINNGDVWLSVASYMHRVSHVKRVAILSHDTLVDGLIEHGHIESQRDNFSSDLVQTFNPHADVGFAVASSGYSKSALSHARSRVMADLRVLFAPGLERSQHSWKCEVAAIILAALGNATKIRNDFRQKLVTMFGADVLTDAYTKKIRDQMTMAHAKRWLDHSNDLGGVFAAANLIQQNVVELV